MNTTTVVKGGAAILGAQNSSLDELLASPLRADRGSAAGSNFSVGTLIALEESGRPLVRASTGLDSPPVVARSVCPIRAEDVGREVVLAFENGDFRKPIILGLVQTAVQPADSHPPVSVSADGEQVTLSAKSEIVLRCGKSSITLTRAGKILIRGAYLLSRSSGVNRIKGGSVQIN